MNRRRNHGMKFLALVLAVLAGACASVQSPTVDEIVASHLAARGGRERIEALRSIRERGTATASGGRVALVVREVKRPDLFRLEFTYQGTTSVFAYDGTKGWQVAPLQGQFAPIAMTPEAEAAGVDQRDIEGPLVDWKEKGHVVRLAGRELVGGKEAFKLEIELKGGGLRHDYIDVASRLLVRSDVTRMVRGHPTVLENSFSDFRDVDGLVLPHAIETTVKDRPEVMRIAIETIEINPPLDDAAFQFPR